MTIASIPRFSAVRLKNGNRTLNRAVEGLLLNDKCYDEVVLPFLNGGICGHKMMDVKVGVDALKKYDKEGVLAGFGVNDFRIGNALKNALRSRYTLDKGWKDSGLNYKRVAMEMSETK